MLDQAEQWIELNRQSAKHTELLSGLTIINAFFENSTRTLLSFEIAGKRAGGGRGQHARRAKLGEEGRDADRHRDHIECNARRIAIVIRHGSSGATGLIADKVDCPVLNAGDGSHEHPTQALLDALTLRHALDERGEGSEDFTGLRVVICGDILHSRVARSNILCLTALGADVRVCAPPALMPAGIEATGVSVFHRFDDALRGRGCGDDAAAPVRTDEAGNSSLRRANTATFTGLTLERLALAVARCTG